jgi:hypothetical protein
VVVPEQDVPKRWKRGIEEVRTAGEKDAVRTMEGSLPGWQARHRTYCFVGSVERPLTVMVSVRSIDAGRAPFPTENDWISGASKVLSLVISTWSSSLFRSTGPR